MSKPLFQFGDRVRHVKRPEWGTGTVAKAELVTMDGLQSQRLSIRFLNGGMKVLSTAHAELEPASADEVATAATHPEAEHPLDVWRERSENGWLQQVAQRKIQEAMLSLPPEARDAFNSLRRRLSFTLDLYRFDRTGGRLVEWGAAQSGLADPLTHYTRHDLEVLFDRWALERDSHLGRLLAEARLQPRLVQELAAAATPAAQQAVRRLNGRAMP